MMLAGSIAVVLLVTRGADRAFAVALAVLGALAFAWMLVSVFWPASADRTCPDCGAEGLERHDATTLHGVTCTRCGSTDLERSSFLFAEEDGRPLEPCVTRERQGTR
jgi:hypothetical protein